MHELAKRAIDLALRPWVPLCIWRTEMASAHLATPDGAPEVRVPGPDPDRILAVGGGLLSGFGVLSYDLSLMGHMARQVSFRTGRGVSLDLSVRDDLCLDQVSMQLSRHNLSSYDAVIVAVGLTDALKRTRLAQWRRSLLDLLDELELRAPAGTHIFIFGVQPAHLVTKLNNPVGRFAEFHGRALDRETARVCAESHRITFVPFCPTSEDANSYRSSRTYQLWADHISPSVSGVLVRSHPTGEPER